MSWLKLKTVEHFARAAFERVAVEFLEPALDFAITLNDRVHLADALRVGHGGLKLLEFGRNSADRSGAVHDLGHGAMPRHFADILIEIADRDAAIDRHLALVGLILAGDHTEQRRLAGPIGPDKADLLTFQERGRSLDEQEMIAMLLADVFETNHDHRGCLRNFLAALSRFALLERNCHPYATGEARRQREISRHAAMGIETGPDNHKSCLIAGKPCDAK